jgi:glycosyltransferase AglD
MKSISLKKVKWFISLAIIFTFIGLSYQFFDLALIVSQVRKIVGYPWLMITILSIYFLSFCLKAIAWKMYLQNRPRFSTCLIGLFYSLLINHLIPIKVGDAVRVAILSETEKHITISESFHSVIVLRMIDIASLLMISMFGLLVFQIDFHIPFWNIIMIIFISGLIMVLLNKKARTFQLGKFSTIKASLLSVKGLYISIIVFISWLLEAAILFGTAWAINQPISALEAIWVNSMTVSGQIFQITPGGIANYEAIMSVSLRLIGLQLKDAYSIALITHGLKFLFSYIVGIYAVLAVPFTFKKLKIWIQRRGAEE